MKNTLILLVTLLVTGVSHAQDGLYAPVLPDDIALVRVINVGISSAGVPSPDEDDPVTVDIGIVQIGPIAPGSGSAYLPVRPGVYVIFANGGREPLTAATGTFHTILIAADRIMIAQDSHHDDPLRSQLILYNMTLGPLQWEALVPRASLLEEVAPGDAGSIAINAIPVTLAALRSHTVKADAIPSDQYVVSIELERGESYALVVSESGPLLQGFVVNGRVSTADASDNSE